MPRIEIHTEIKAKKEIVFDLSRSIDLHTISTEQTRETAIAGRTNGLMEMNETVTWRAKHFGIYQKLSSRITGFDRPHSFTDEMIRGAFAEFQHQHLFKDMTGGTLMIDIFDYKSPFGFLGKLADKLFLRKYMKELLITRNRVVKDFAETEKWRNIPGVGEAYHDN